MKLSKKEEKERAERILYVFQDCIKEEGARLRRVDYWDEDIPVYVRVKKVREEYVRKFGKAFILHSKTVRLFLDEYGFEPYKRYPQGAVGYRISINEFMKIVWSTNPFFFSFWKRLELGFLSRSPVKPGRKVRGRRRVPRARRAGACNKQILDKPGA